MAAMSAALLLGLVILAPTVCVLGFPYPHPATLQKVVFSTPVPPQCSDSRQSTTTLRATKDTVSWGAYYQGTKPAAVVHSGSIITVEMLTHQAADAYDLMIKGDAAMEEIYKWDASGISITQRGPGKHLLTGPIYICGAQPGDTVKVEILDLWPRVNPSNGRSYGSNQASNWGYQYRIPFRNNAPPSEHITIYELTKAPITDWAMYAAPRFQFPFKATEQGTTTSCFPDDEASRTWPRTYDGLGYVAPPHNNSFGQYGRVECVGGKQTWPAIVVGGTPNNKTLADLTAINPTNAKIPINIHIGNIGLAQDINIPYTSTTPSDTGHNMDIRYLGKGSTLYLPVRVPGGLLMAGDTQAAQGNSEYDGTAIEFSATGRFRISLIKKGSEPPIVPAKHNLKFPLVENADRYFLVNYAYEDYIGDLLGKTVYAGRIPAACRADPAPPNCTITPIGPITNPMRNIGVLGADLNRAMDTVARNTRDWLMGAFSVNENTANSIMSLGVDFEVTQVVDQNWGIHASIPKYLFQGPNDGRLAIYTPETITGGSLLVETKLLQRYFYSGPRAPLFG